MSKRRKEIGFAIFYFGTIGWFIVSSLLGFAGTWFLDFLILSFMTLETFGCMFLSLKISGRYPIAEGDADEIKREDDVLLQGTPFISAVLLFYLNALVTDTHNRITLANAIVYLTVTFFVLRGYAKIRSNPKARLFSALILVWLASSYGFVLLVSYSPSIFPNILKMPILGQVLYGLALAIVPILGTALALVYLTQRYGLTNLTKLRATPTQRQKS